MRVCISLPPSQLWLLYSPVYANEDPARRYRAPILFCRRRFLIACSPRYYSATAGENSVVNPFDVISRRNRDHFPEEHRANVTVSRTDDQYRGFGVFTFIATANRTCELYVQEHESRLFVDRDFDFRLKTVRIVELFVYLRRALTWARIKWNQEVLAGHTGRHDIDS